MYARYKIRYLSSFILLEADCVGTFQYKGYLGRIIVMVYYSKLDNAIC